MIFYKFDIFLAIVSAFSVLPFSQVARVRLHGFSDREISVVRSLLMSEIESAYLERDQTQSTSLRDELIQVCLDYLPSFFSFLFLSLN